MWEGVHFSPPDKGEMPKAEGVSEFNPSLTLPLSGEEAPAFTFWLSSVTMGALITFIRVSVKEISLIKKTMPITQSAKKALRGSLKKKAINDRSKKLVKESIKSIEKLVKEKKKDEAKKLLPAAYSTIDKAAKKGIFKKNNASRKKARLSKITK